MTELLILALLAKTKMGGAMMSWILSKLFPAWEPEYHIYRRKTKSIPVMSGSAARAYMMHLAPNHKSILWTWGEY